jgi:hypothetical protein
VATKAPRKTISIFCEGQRTEPEYLEALKRDPLVHNSAAVELRIERRRSGFVPLSLVKMAIEAKRRSELEEGEVDEFWCVFDVEWPRNHPKLPEAIDLAKRHGIELAISNPCFELWLILHFEDCGSFMNNDEARRRRRDCDNEPTKGLDGSRYMPHKLEAARRALWLEKRHVRERTKFPQDNPSSGMHRLIASVTSSR